jgi:hypothetical protein
VKLAAPLKFGAGVKTTLPPTRLTVPSTASCTLVIVSALPSMSVSLPSKVATGTESGVSSVAGSVSGAATGASLTAAMLKLKVLGDRSVFRPPLAVPPLSTTWKVNAPRPVPLTLAAGVKVSWPRLPAGIAWPAVTATPFRRSTPCEAGGSVVTITDCRPLGVVSPASVSGKSAAEKVWVASSSIATVRSAPAGASLTAVIAIVAVSVSVSVPPVPVLPRSLVVMVSVTLPLAFATGA